jgi:PAS domain S-box-containing protein
MVAKTDKEEILAPFKRYSVTTVFVIILLILINASIFGFWIWQQRIKFYRSQLKNEVSLRESEERFRSLYENVTIGIYRTTLDGRILMSNPAMVSMLGFDTFEQLAQRNLQMEGYEPDYPRSKFLESIERDGRIIGLESAWNQKNGKTLIVRESANAVRDAKGRILYYDGTVEDITDRKKTEEALRESEERFSKSFKTSPISFMIANMEDGRIIEINDAFTSISGFSREEAIGNTTLNMKIWVHEEDRKRMIVSLRNGKAILHKETMLRSKEGKVAIVLLSAQIIKLANRNCIISSIEDITKRKEVEDELRIQSEIMSHMAEAVYLVRMEDGIIVYTNSKFEELFGYGPGDMTGKHVSIVNAPTEKSPEQTAIEIMSQLDKKGFWTGEVLNIKKDGTVFWSHANVAIFNHSKYGKVLVSVQEDITDRKNAEFQIKKLNEELEVRVIQRTELLEAANKELEAFSYSVSHDLRAPLRSVHGFTKILLEDYEASLDEEGKRICGIISTSATQMGELIDDLLSFSRIGRSSVNPSEIDMKKMAKVVFEGMTSPAERKRIKLKIGKLSGAFGDVTLFGQVWTNLISNAIKYTSKNDVSEINIGSKVDGKLITYFIKDNGVGFDMQYGHKLFGVFQRLHSEAEFEGNGVGLAIVQRIILKHGGKVWAEGEVGKGATFYFSLPVQDINKKTHDTRLTTHG